VSGGVKVTLTGAKLAKVTKVTFGGTAGKNLKVVSAKKLTVVTPRHVAGLVPVRAFSGKRASTVRKQTRYRYVYVRPGLAGGFHSVALRRDGTVFTWGSDLYGEQAHGPGVRQHVDRPKARARFKGARAVA